MLVLEAFIMAGREHSRDADFSIKIYFNFFMIVEINR